MDKLQIRKEIAALINSIKAHSDNIVNLDMVPQLELELILHKIEKLYQKSIVLNHLNSLNDTNGLTNISKLETNEYLTKIEIVKLPETPIARVDLFGAELIDKTEKPKIEKKIEKKAEASPVNKIQNPPITDLKASIGINDKFQFANDLFENSMQEYEIAIQQLNTAETIDSAMDYFSTLQQLYNWDPKNEVAKRLADIVVRRYS